jgi:3-hydroxybutyryl-CoA dehydratase
MTASRAPRVRLGTQVCRYSELAVGDELCDALTITETHVVMAAGVFNDPGPNHVNALHAAGNEFGRRIAHGPLLIGVMDGVIGNVLGSSIVALLEQHATFRAPVFLGDTIRCRWRVSAMVDKPRFGGGGVVTFTGEVAKPDGTVVAEMTSILAVADEPTGRACAHATTADPR